MTDQITLSWSSIGAIAGIVVLAMGMILAYVHLLVDAKLAKRDQAWKEWATKRFDTLDNHIKSPELIDRVQVMLSELQRRGKLG